MRCPDLSPIFRLGFACKSLRGEQTHPFAEFDLRVGTAFSAVCRRHSGETLVIVCHGGVIDGVLRHALKAPRTGVFELHTTNTSLTEIVQARPDRWRLVRYNDAAHLAGLPDASPRMSDG